MDFSPDMRTNFLLTVKSILSLVVITLFISSCSTHTPTTPKIKPIDNSNTANKKVSTIKSAQYYIEQAQLLSTTNTLQSLDQLVAASEQYLVESNTHQALWLANKTSVVLEEQTYAHSSVDNSSTSTAVSTEELNLIYRLYLVKIASLQQLQQQKLSIEQLQELDDFTTTHQLKHTIAYYQLAKLIAKQNALDVDSVDAQLRIIDLSPHKEDLVFELWQSLSKLSQWQIKQLDAKNPPDFSGWKNLLSIANKQGDKQEAFGEVLKQWQTRYPHHIANTIVPTLLESNTLAVSSFSNIAVFLPLSGNQQMAGLVAQEGVLAAFEQNSNRKLHFFDENTIDMTTLPTIFETNNIDYVIGPLLKSNVEAYLNQPDLIIPTLLLNLTEQTLLPHQVALSMRREDEARQAASTLSQKDYKHPLILVSNTNINKRIAETFANQWEAINQQKPELVLINTGDKMQDDLKTSLGIDHSLQRINELKRQFKETLKTEFRNRRDIDMIYLVANPTDSKLLKPFIDVNISPFSSIIPIFASSLSHSINDDLSDNRDLTNLTFTEIPWLLNSDQQNKSLASVSRKLWPQRSDSLQRIFAMGYDSLFLVNKVPNMKQSSYIKHYGQTGILSLGDDNILTRSLIWGRYEKNSVRQINMN